MMTRAEYEAGMAEIDRLWDESQASGDCFLRLVLSCEEFERRHYPLTDGPELTTAQWAEYHRENGRLPCGHMSREICSAAQCNGVPKLRDPMGEEPKCPTCGMADSPYCSNSFHLLPLDKRK